jgi:hypothetical protein
MKIELSKDTEGEIVIGGAIDEKFSGFSENLYNMVEKIGGKVAMDIEEVVSMNSVGTSYWLKFLESIPSSIHLSFKKCQPSYINYINMIPFKADSWSIFSLFVPYECEHCGNEWSEIVEINDAESADSFGEFDEVDCVKCRTSTFAAEEAADYLIFLDHK